MPTAGTLTMTSPRKRLVQCSRWFLHHQQDLRRFINWGNNCISSQQASPITKFSVKMTLTKSWLISFQLCTVHSLNQEAATSGSCCNFGPPVRRSAARPDPSDGTALPCSSERRAASLVARGRVLEARASTRTMPADELIAGTVALMWPPPRAPQAPPLACLFPSASATALGHLRFLPRERFRVCAFSLRGPVARKHLGGIYLSSQEQVSLSPSSFQICLWRLQGRQTWCSDTNMRSWEL